MPIDEVDEDLLIEFYLGDDPVYCAIEMVDVVDMTRQGVHKRFEKLEDAGYLNSKNPGRDRMYWLTDVGEELAKESVRDARRH